MVTPAGRGWEPTNGRSEENGTSSDGRRALLVVGTVEAFRSRVKYARGETCTKNEREGTVRYGSGRL